MNVKRIGLYASLATCRMEGYMVMEYYEKVFKHGQSKMPIRDRKLDPDCKVRLTVSNPEMWMGGRINPKANGIPYFLDEELSLNEIINRYMRDPVGISKFMGLEKPLTSAEIRDFNIYDFLELAASVNSYVGLQ